MAKPNLIPALCSLVELEPPEISGQGIEMSPDRSALLALAKLGALVHTGNSDSAVCFGCDEPHPMAVEYAEDGQYRGFCREAGFQPIEADSLRRFGVSDDWIVAAVRSSLAIGAGQSTVTIASMLKRIGRVRFGAYRCELFYGRRLFERARFEEVRQTIVQLVDKSAAILLTSTPIESIVGEPPPRCAISALEEVLQVTADSTSFNDEPVLAALRGGDRRLQSDGVGFSFSPGFRSAVVGDREYRFSDKQALVVEALFKARQSGSRSLHQTEIQGEADTSQRVGQLFARHQAYGTLIKHDHSGYYWLDV